MKIEEHHTTVFEVQHIQMTSRRVTSFHDIHVPPNSLVVLDIDDTTIRFEELGRHWWIEREAEFKKTHSHQEARDLVMAEWIEGARVFKPILTDPDGFPAFLERVFSAPAHLIFLTARSPDLRQLTEVHMTSCGITVDTEKIYYSRDKGPTLRAIVEPQAFSSVVFVDDMEHNLESVTIALKGLTDLRTYHFHKFAPALII